MSCDIIDLEPGRIELLQSVATIAGESRDCAGMQSRQPISGGANRIDENELVHCLLILRSRKHGNPAAPGMSQHIPSLDAERFADCRDVAGVVLDARSPRSRWLLRLAAAPLIEEHKLPMLGQRTEGWPENVMPEMQAAVDAHERQSAINGGTRECGEVEPARTNCLMDEYRRPFLLSPKGEKSLSRRSMMRFCHA